MSRLIIVVLISKLVIVITICAYSSNPIDVYTASPIQREETV